MMPTDDIERDLRRYEAKIVDLKRRSAQSECAEQRARLKTSISQLGDLCKDLRRKIVIRKGLLRRA